MGGDTAGKWQMLSLYSKVRVLSPGTSQSCLVKCRGTKVNSGEGRGQREMKAFPLSSIFYGVCTSLLLACHLILGEG